MICVGKVKKLWYFNTIQNTQLMMNLLKRREMKINLL